MMTSVLVVGAGPTGLAGAVALAAAGCDVTVLDASARGVNTSRAAVVHPRTLEVLDALGAASPILDRAVRVPYFEVHAGARRLARLDFSGPPTRFPFTAMISQAETEAILRDRLTGLGGQVRWQHELLTLDQDATGVTAGVRGPDGAVAVAEVRADLVVGADGMHSRVRELSGIGFPGAAYAQSFLLADVRLDGAPPRDTVSLSLHPDGLVVVAPLPDDRYRVVATVDDAPERPDRAQVQQVLAGRGSSGRVDEVVWSGRFRVHHRLAETFRSGRVLLAGDAAHVHSPAGGQGMNTGVQDAVVLAAVVAGGGDLDAYGAARRPVAQRVVRLTDRMTRAATVSGPRAAGRNVLVRAAGSVPAVRRRLAMELSELAYR